MPQRLLTVCGLDLMAAVLLRPWLRALRKAGWEVHVACRPGEYVAGLEDEGFRVHPIPLQRCVWPWAHLIPLAGLCSLMRRGKFDAVSCHGPIAAALGRLAACAAGVPCVIYAVHGFYFHDGTFCWLRRALITVERALGRITDHFLFLSAEDQQTALQEGIARRPEQTTLVGNGVDLGRFYAAPRSAPHQITVGIVARIVKEKGYREFFEMARQVARLRPEVHFLVVGDDLVSDRDRFGAALRRQVSAQGLSDRFEFVGFTDAVPLHLRRMDIFVLPSYREGVPRSVLEAMASGLPVVATDIRGCREAIVHGETGLLVPSRNASTLTQAVLYLLEHSEAARRMGEAGRRRANTHFDQRLVQDRFVAAFRRMLGSSAVAEAHDLASINQAVP